MFAVQPAKHFAHTSVFVCVARESHRPAPTWLRENSATLPWRSARSHEKNIAPSIPSGQFFDFVVERTKALACNFAAIILSAATANWPLAVELA